MTHRLAPSLGWLAAAGLALVSPVMAAPSLTPAQAYTLFAAAGFPIGPDKHPVNRCGQAANPKVTFVDMNGDHRPEALFIDEGGCYKPDGRWFAVTTQQSDGQWRRVLEGEGTVSAANAASAGWLVLTTTSAGETVRLHYDGRSYVAANGQPPSAPAEATRTSTAGKGAADPDGALYLAAGLKRVHGHWESGCNEGNDPGGSYEPATITDRKDLNGDGRPDAIITESGGFCYGATGQAFWIVSRQPDGGWKLMLNEIGIPDVRKTKGVGGWPDILVGGPGMCFPVERWNGAAYKAVGFNDGDKPCKPTG